MIRFTAYLLLLFYSSSFAQTKILSWNIENLGKSKSQTDLIFIANTIKNYDLIAIQEVVAGVGGAQAVAQIVTHLNQGNSHWDYSISDPTTGTAHKKERYAYFWKTSKVKLISKPLLEQNYQSKIEREPYLATFLAENKKITLASFHAISKNKQPETEIKYLKFLPDIYPKLNILFLGDFNCPEYHSVFNPLKKIGYKSSFIKTKTTLKKECKNGNCLASEYDNILYPANKIQLKNKGVILFYKSFKNLKEARKISDHLPIWIEI